MDFHKFEFKPHSVDFLIGLYSLSFTQPAIFEDFIHNIFRSLSTGGVIVANFFSQNDDWHLAGLKDITFVSKRQLMSYLPEDVVIELLQEREWDGPQYSGVVKHWHTVEIIARRKC